MRGLAATKKSVNDRPGVEQLADGGEHRCSSNCCVWPLTGGRSQIGPRRGHQSAAAVGQHHQQLEETTSIVPTQQLKRVPLERMTTSTNLHPLWVTIEMLAVMGSMSSIRFNLNPGWVQNDDGDKRLPTFNIQTAYAPWNHIVSLKYVRPLLAATQRLSGGIGLMNCGNHEDCRSNCYNPIGNDLEPGSENKTTPPSLWIICIIWIVSVSIAGCAIVFLLHGRVLWFLVSATIMILLACYLTDLLFSYSDFRRRRCFFCFGAGGSSMSRFIILSKLAPIHLCFKFKAALIQFFLHSL